MLNVNSIQDRLAGMSLPQLQQYAQLHKDDPYIVTMAMHVASMKRKMATAEQGQPTPPQPPVVEQAIAQMAPAPQQAPRAMLPEEQGIGALPERSLAKMAGGGIVAFEEGGEVERYEAGGGILANSPTTAARLRPLQDAVNMARAQYDAAARSNDPNAVATYLPALQAAQAKLNDAITTSMGAGNLNQALSELQQPTAQPAAPIPALEGESNFLDQQPEAQQAAAPREDVKPTATALAVSPEMSALQALAASQQQPGAAGVPGAGGIGALPKMSDYMPKTPSEDPFKKQRQEVWDEIKKQREDEVVAFEKDIKAQGLFGLEREKRLKEREGKLDKRESENTGLALMNAGFAMMAGDSQYALQNIGKGAQIGTKAYVEGKEKIDAAREKLDDAFSRIDEIRRSEGIANAKELRGLKSLVRSTVAEAKKDFLNATERSWGYDREDAKTMWNGAVQYQLKKADIEAANARSANEIRARAQIALAEIGSRERVAGMPSAEMKYAMALGAGESDQARLKSGTEVLQKIKAGKFDPYTAYSNMVTKIVSQGGATTDAPSYPEFLRMLGLDKVSKPEAGATVRERKQ